MVDRRLALCHRNISLRSIERVDDIHLVAVSIPTYEAAAMGSSVGGQQATIIHAASDVYGMV